MGVTEGEEEECEVKSEKEEEEGNRGTEGEEGEDSGEDEPALGRLSLVSFRINAFERGGKDQPRGKRRTSQGNVPHRLPSRSKLRFRIHQASG